MASRATVFCWSEHIYQAVPALLDIPCVEYPDRGSIGGPIRFPSIPGVSSGIRQRSSFLRLLNCIRPHRKLVLVAATSASFAGKEIVRGLSDARFAGTRSVPEPALKDMLAAYDAAPAPFGQRAERGGLSRPYEFRRVDNSIWRQLQEVLRTIQEVRGYADAAARKFRS
jgi:hypothetical protein